MNTIEKRAVGYCMTHLPQHESADAESVRIGYIQGATEMLDSVSEWILNNIGEFRWAESEEKYSRSEFVERLRNAMTE